MSTIFISGSTGYLGRPLTKLLVAAGHDVRALTRPQSIRKLPLGCTPIPGDALDPATFVTAVPTGTTFIHLTGVSHPSPAKANEFRSIDQVSFEASLQAAQTALVRHFIYVSVAHPAPIMRAYIAVRRECERQLQQSRLNATILRPWYVLGPGHRWPSALIPFYKLAESVPMWRESAQRLGLVTHTEMLAALVHSAGTPRRGVVVQDVPAIRAISHATDGASQSAPSSSNRRSPNLWA